MPKLDILFVESDPEYSMVLRELSTLDEFQFRMVNSDAGAKTCLEEEQFEILVIDSVKGRVSGIEILKWARGHGKHMPVILLSNSQGLGWPEALALNDCCTTVLKKPFSFDDLVSAIHAAKGRNHQFQCEGKVCHPASDGAGEAFEGMHYLP